jgi:hypothetical protein
MRKRAIAPPPRKRFLDKIYGINRIDRRGYEGRVGSGFFSIPLILSKAPLSESGRNQMTELLSGYGKHSSRPDRIALYLRLLTGNGSGFLTSHPFPVKS